ncbi:RagB/SusD family nutrient uptake outer membrane protein [Persicobacter diffluens]|uniref:Membrane protein n=1 Tax=Persicobacter diffluens TaxID=981 RepID=A0AAN4W2N0_9BACT|nr:membrane protein [Persicobacter diffluens]
MKKNLIYLFIVLFSFSACENFLEEEIKSNVVAEDYYATSAGYQSLVHATYSSLREYLGQHPWLFISGTDLYTEGRDPAPIGLSRYTNLNSNSEGVDFLYINCYKSIQLANNAVYYGDITEQTADVDRLVGEAKFIRALSYFYLVQTYGGVSLIDMPVTEAITKIDRNTEEEIYAFIIQDLEDARNRVKNGAFEGMVTRRAVVDLLAKVHLTRGYQSYGASDDFQKAAQYADEAIEGQGLNLSFAELWTPGNEMNEEVLFSVQFSQASISTNPSELGNRMQNFFGPYLGGSEVAGDNPYKMASTSPSLYAMELFEEGDSRYEVTFMTKIYDRYYDFYDVDVADHPTLDVSHFYAPKWFTPADSTAFRAAHPEAFYHSFYDSNPDTGDSNLDFSTISIKKFDDPKSLYAAGNSRTSSRDVIISRLAETYLIAAEAYLQAGQAQTGLDRLNTVRKRAGAVEASLAEFDINYILDERGRELLGEYKRWFDLKRTGTLVKRASQYNRLVEESNFVGNGGELKILRPIPQAALDLNQSDQFKQNPAYQ